MRQRFVLLFHARCGSNLITMALAGHPQIVMYRELFHDAEVVRKGYLPAAGTAGPADETDYYRDGGDPIAFLRQQLYERDFPPAKTAVGFKLGHIQMRHDAALRVCHLLGTESGTHRPFQPEVEDRFWNWLSADRDIRVLSLYRQSLLQTMVSALRALKSKQWLLPIGERNAASDERLFIPVEKFRKFVDLVTADRERACALFADHPMLTLEYQKDVVDQYDVSIRRIEDFLGVAPSPLPRKLQKQAQVPVSEALSNFAELRAAVVDTKYEAHL